MNKNAQKWVEALESGRFKQGRYYLTNNDEHCCLGVACVLYQEEVGDLDISPDQYGHVYYNGATTILPPRVADWLGLMNEKGGYIPGGYIPGSDPFALREALSADNDRGATFAQIAATIRSEPKELFADESPSTD